MIDETEWTIGLISIVALGLLELGGLVWLIAILSGTDGPDVAHREVEVIVPDRGLLEPGSVDWLSECEAVET